MIFYWGKEEGIGELAEHLFVMCGHRCGACTILFFSYCLVRQVGILAIFMKNKCLLDVNHPSFCAIFSDQSKNGNEGLPILHGHNNVDTALTMPEIPKSSYNTCVGHAYPNKTASRKNYAHYIEDYDSLQQEDYILNSIAVESGNKRRSGSSSGQDLQQEKSWGTFENTRN